MKKKNWTKISKNRHCVQGGQSCGQTQCNHKLNTSLPIDFTRFGCFNISSGFCCQINHNGTRFHIIDHIFLNQNWSFLSWNLKKQSKFRLFEIQSNFLKKLAPGYKKGPNGGQEPNCISKRYTLRPVNDATEGSTHVCFLRAS